LFLFVCFYRNSLIKDFERRGVNLNEKAMRVLEYNKIKEMIADMAASELGKDIARALMPSHNISEVKELLQETSEAVKLILKKGSVPLSGLHDIRSSLRKAKIGSSLTAGELLKVADSLRTARKLKKYMGEGRNDETYPILEEMIECISAFKNIEDSIYMAIASEDEISDNASPTLKSIRRKIKEKNANIREKLNQMIGSHTFQKFLQDPIISIRGDRFVVPVKQEFKGSVPGLIHDQSSSGATLFIEPMAVVEMNNDLRQLQLQENVEIEKILFEFTMQIQEKHDFLKVNLEILATLDFIFAKANFSLENRCSEPDVNSNGIINIKKGRHPLIKSDQVVPIDIYLGEQFNTLVVTGPNTGGKTVTLKTLGLLTLMAQSGLHIPAGDYSEIAIFEEVFADIGDEQSIEQSLSTFSSHMTNIVSIINNVKDNSLVLFDELGAGTDPTEGAALAISILELLHKKNIRTVATTHYSELKLYALSTQGVCNASVEFDILTLRPTYRLLIGIPGKSNAFEISFKLGLNESIIERAREFLSQDNIKFEDVINNLQTDLKNARDEYDNAHRIRVETEKIKKELDKKKEMIDSQKDKLLQDARNEALRIVKSAKEESNELIKELKEAIENENIERSALIEKTKSSLKSSEDKLQEKIGQALFGKVNNSPPKNLKIGDTVKILNLDQKGTVSSLPDDNGNLIVRAGIMKVNVNISNLQLTVDEKEAQERVRYSKINTVKTSSVSTQVDVRGESLDEALQNVDKYLDDAYLANLSQVTVIHGKGTGVLRAGITQLLKSHSHVKSYRVGGYREGGIGATIVEIK